MMRNNFNILCTGFFLLILIGAVNAQKLEKGQIMARAGGGVALVFTSETDPPGAGQQAVGMIQVVGGNKNLFHRAFIDKAGGVYFGYDVEVEPVLGTNQYKLIFNPLSITPKIPPTPPRRLTRASGAGGNADSKVNNRQAAELIALTLPGYPEPQIVQIGDTVSLDLLVNPQTGVKIIDLIKIYDSTNDPVLPFSNVSGGAAGTGGNRPAADFSADAMGFKVTSSILKINGQSVNDDRNGSRLGVTGILIWFYTPERGRFILSLVPRAGYNFQKTGTIQGNKIAFSMDGNDYEWISQNPIVAGGSGNWNLWVLHDPHYRSEFPPSPSTPYVVGAAGDIERLIKKK